MTDPDWSEILKNVVTSTAILLGGAWAAWKWGYGETLRRQREMPSPDGSLTATFTPFDETTTAVTLNATWRNRGPLPIELCARHSVLRAFKLGKTLPIGNLIMEKMPIVAEVEAPWSDYILEPNTDSVMTEHFLLKNDGIYGFKWRICLGQMHRSITGSTRHIGCERELLWRPDLDAVDRSCP